MKKAYLFTIITALSLLPKISHCDPGSPRVFPIEITRIETLKTQIKEGSPLKNHNLRKITEKADSILETKKLYSVTDNKSNALSGNPHDYYSQSPYWWPNPESENGLPYIRKDGEVNPERDLVSDRKACEKMIGDVRTLILAYTFTENEDYAIFASQLLKTWFLEQETKMTPRLEYGQAVPGIHNGKGAGIIATRKMAQMVFLLPLLEESPHWTKKDQGELKKWFKEYSLWLDTNSTALQEKARQNNHGSAYDMQLIAYSIYSDQVDIAKKILNQSVRSRINKQIEANGTQPIEIERTKSWHYSIENLKYIMSACVMGKKLGIDLFNEKGADGAGIKEALDYLAPYVKSDMQWPHKQIKKFEPERLRYLLLLGQLIYKDDQYHKLLKEMNWKQAELIDELCLPVL